MFHSHHSSSFCKNKSGELIKNKKEVLNRREEFFSELLNGYQSREIPQVEDSLYFDNTEDVPLPSLEEVETAIHNLKNNKSAGSDGIPVEIFKAADTNFNSVFHQLLLEIWNAERMSSEGK